MRMIAAAVLVLALSTAAAADQVADDFVLTGTVAPGSVVSLRGEWTAASNAVPVFLRALNAREDVPASNTDLAEGVLKFTVPPGIRRCASAAGSPPTDTCPAAGCLRAWRPAFRSDTFSA